MTEYIIRPPERVDSSLSLQPIIVGEIVRCRDCRFYEEEGFCNWFECSYCYECQRVEPDGYCAWGERKQVDEC